MNFFLQPRAQNLSEWLDLATRDLVPAARAHVSPEIEAHFNEAVQAHLQNGETAPTAQTLALKELGNPQSAARRFRREYLTTKESTLLARLVKSTGDNGTANILLFLFWGTQPVYDFYARQFNDSSYPVFLAVHLIILSICLPTCFIISSLTKQPITSQSRDRIILLNAIMWLSVSPLFVLQSMLPASTSPHVPIDTVLNILLPLAKTAATVWAIRFSYHLLRLRQKLASANENDLPPSNSAAA